MDFAALLRDGDVNDDDEISFDGDTVSTVRQVQEMDRMISADHRFSEDNATVSTMETYTESIETVRQHRETKASGAGSSTLSSVMNEDKAVLPFRESPTTVRPNEQVHRATPGALCLSPMQRTPMQALKWRALVAAAQEKEIQRPFGKSMFPGIPKRKSLAERNPNVML